MICGSRPILSAARPNLRSAAASDGGSFSSGFTRMARSYLNFLPRRRGKKFKYDLAILVNPDENDPPSDAAALRKFGRAAESIGLDPQIITREDYRRVAEFDALFIRETTAVNHHTFRFSRRAPAEGLAVIDDPESIIRCSNEVY